MMRPRRSRLVATCPELASRTLSPTRPSSLARAVIIGDQSREGLACRSEKLSHVFVVDRRKVQIPEPHSAEIISGVWANDLVGFLSHEIYRLPGADRRGGDYPACTSFDCPADRRDHRRSGGKAVVDEQCRPAGERGLEARAPKLAVQRPSVALCQCDRGRELFVRQPVTSANVCLRSRGDGSQCVFGLEWMRHLPHRDEVEWKAERTRDSGREYDPAPREADDDCVLVDLTVECAGKYGARVQAVAEDEG